MTSNYAKKEREFLKSLKEDTGRDLQAWMAAIDRQGLTHRDDIIDWLREQGFIFSWASWLERIHNNSGQPIYWDQEPGASKQKTFDGRNPERSNSEPETSVPIPAPEKGKPNLRLVSSRTETGPETGQSSLRLSAGGDDHRKQMQNNNAQAGSSAGIESIIANSKAFAPLARHFIQYAETQMPGLVVETARQHVVLKRPGAFAVLAPYSSGLRLGLALGNAAFDLPLVKAKFPPPLNQLSHTFTHMIVLDDARQVDSELINHLREANRRVNGTE